MSTSTTLSPKEVHHQSLISLIVAGVLAFLVGLVFWFVTTNQSSTNNTVSNGPTDTRAEVAALLMNAKNQASEADISNIAAKLSNSKVKVTDAERAKVAGALENL